MRMRSYLLAGVFLACGFTVMTGRADAGESDPYFVYLQQAEEFKPVKHDKSMLTANWNTWTYMPWRYQWNIGTGDEGGRFCKEYGFNGGFTDHGNPSVLPWFEKWGLKFYADHTAAKGFLYLRGANSGKPWRKYQRNARAVRPQPLDANLLAKLKGIVGKYVRNLKGSPMRAAYALDDEISWGAFVKPLPWRVNADDAAYAAWLKRYYGAGKAPKPQYVTPDQLRGQLSRSVQAIDFSPLLDRITYNDSVWANFLGALVTHANSVDPQTPCGFVGGQAPNIWGGYDYAKIMKKVQFIEAYDLGCNQEIIRSFNPDNAMPVVTTHFHKGKSARRDIWWMWHYFVHGNRGVIGWVAGWFDGKTPKPWLRELAPTLKELGGVQGPKLVGAKWLHDKVAVYYSHPSIQVSWMLDIQPHGSTWVNRNSDSRLGTSHNVRKAWDYILADSGLQYNFVSYDQVALHGVPREYKVLILPAVFALSDLEAKRIREFCERGGTVIADFMCGLFDQHGKGRSRGALDELFGVEHTGTETQADFFGPKLWVESNQDSQFSYKRYRTFFDSVPSKLVDGFARPEKRLAAATERAVGKGRAVYLNLSPQRYLQYRQENSETQAQRDLFLKYVWQAGVKSPVTITGADGKRPRKVEATYWRKNGRVLVFITYNSAVTGNSAGGGTAASLAAGNLKLRVTLPFTARQVRDERANKDLGAGKEFSFTLDPTQAVFFSFAAPGR